MEYKYNIHISEDLEKHEETVRKILAFNDSFKGTEDELLSLCEDWFSFKRFLHPGKAIEFYEKSKMFPDIKIQDIDFTELKPTDAPPKYRENISGIYEIEYLLKRNSGINANSKTCFIIPFTGKLDDALIVKALHKTGWERQTIGKVKALTDTRLIKDEQAQLKLRIEENLKELAIVYFSKLTQPERNKLEKIANEGIYSSWRNYIVKFEDYDFKLRNMLVGFGDINKMKPNEVNDIVKDLLNKSEVEIDFMGRWKRNPVYKNMLHKYWKDKNYWQVKRHVNLRAIDVVLEIMMLVEDENYNPELLISLSKKNTLYKIAYIPKGIEEDKIFIDKLVGRRVAIALSLLYDLSDEKFNIRNACLLITRGVNDNSKIESEDLIGPTMTEFLGLHREDNRVIIHRTNLMPEELDFAKLYVSNIQSLKVFLKEFDVHSDVIDDFKGEFTSFNDLSSFNEFIFEFQKQKPDEINILLDEINDKLNQDKYLGAKNILSMSNSLFV